MLAAMQLDDWPEAAYTYARVARPRNPLGVFDPHECGAWVDTLRALRALPNRARGPGHAGASGNRIDANEDGDS